MFKQKSHLVLIEERAVLHWFRECSLFRERIVPSECISSKQMCHFHFVRALITLRKMRALSLNFTSSLLLCMCRCKLPSPRDNSQSCTYYNCQSVTNWYYQVYAILLMQLQMRWQHFYIAWQRNWCMWKSNENVRHFNSCAKILVSRNGIKAHTKISRTSNQHKHRVSSATDDDDDDDKNIEHE